MDDACAPSPFWHETSPFPFTELPNEGVICAMAATHFDPGVRNGYALSFPSRASIATTRTANLSPTNAAIASLADGFTVAAWVRFDSVANPFRRATCNHFEAPTRRPVPSPLISADRRLPLEPTNMCMSRVLHNTR